ncbi:MAG: ATP-binding cassette domain-containing protein [Clostridia bacterium]|nr:ATP-binding cassette domain-containing protein [Clostridia bacterium]
MLKLQSIVKDYVVNKELTVHALKGVSIDFRQSEFVSILGPSGCGKTTLLNVIGGLDHYTTGDLQIDGVSTKEYSEKDWDAYRNEQIGFVFQSYNLIPHQRVVENVELALTISGVGKEERRKRAIKALEEVGLAAEIYKKPNQLSGGQMQRVALARALVNNPQIVLADEPTGALDSVTSVQVMDLLKEIAKNRLVIMVTHNSELAEKYSTRIIRLHDGEVISDSNPYVAPQATVCKDDQQVEPCTKAKARGKRKVKMSFATSLSLSLKNLLTKKGRTVMTSFAGSIGIIGVALVLALSNGFNNYIAKLQSDTLSGYPITISQVAADPEALYEEMMQNAGNKLPNFPKDDNNVHVYNPEQTIGTLAHYNLIDNAYYSYVNDFYREQMALPQEERLINDVQYSYATDLKVITKSGDNYVLVKNPESSMLNLFIGTTSVFQEALSNTEFVLSQYDELYGHYPINANEIAIVVDSQNRISTSTLTALGIAYSETDGKYQDIAFSSLVGKEFKLVYNDAFYLKDGLSYKAVSTQEQLEAAYNDTANTETLTISGIIRVKEDAPLSLYSAGLLYMPSLTQKYIANSKDSQIAKAQTESTVYYQTKTGVYTQMPLSLVKTALSATYKNITDEQAMQMVMQQFGASEVPTAIYIYPKDFDSKDEIIAFLDGWSQTEAGKANKIIYSDATEVLSSSMGQMIDIISAVLVAFASISLVVSSVMIAIITYTSVIERTKEIGVLRSLGASKRDVSNVFNAESFLIGLSSGVIGIAITYLLCIPTNIILKNVAKGVLMVNIASLAPTAAIALVVISCVLTVLAGFVPSAFASKMDPVKALRSE